MIFIWFGLIYNNIVIVNTLPLTKVDVAQCHMKHPKALMYSALENHLYHSFLVDLPPIYADIGHIHLVIN